LADPLRVATFNTELSRKGPGLLLRDILEGDDAQITAVLDTLVQADADIIALQGFDYDLEGRALAAFARALAEHTAPYPYQFAAPPNAGRMTQVDLDGDGKTHTPRDAQGFGRFFGEGAMAVLSRYPIDLAGVQDFSTRLWADMPDTLFPAGAAFQQGRPLQRLSSHGHWSLPIEHPDFGRINILTFHATPPVFDGPEDRNGRRNHDEILFWQHHLAGDIGREPQGAFVLMGDANSDPNKGESRRSAITNLLADARLQDPLPDQDTVLWPQTGPMRVDYVLPSTEWRVVGASVLGGWDAASRHRLVWVDLVK